MKTSKIKLAVRANKKTHRSTGVQRVVAKRENEEVYKALIAEFPELA